MAGTCWGAAPGALQCTLGSFPYPCAHLGSQKPTLSRVVSPWMLAPHWAVGPRAEVMAWLLAVPIWHGTAGAPACHQWPGMECSQCRQDAAPQGQQCGQGQLPQLPCWVFGQRQEHSWGQSTTARKGTLSPVHPTTSPALCELVEPPWEPAGSH